MRKHRFWLMSLCVATGLTGCHAGPCKTCKPALTGSDVYTARNETPYARMTVTPVYGLPVSRSASTPPIVSAEPAIVSRPTNIVTPEIVEPLPVPTAAVPERTNAIAVTPPRPRPTQPPRGEPTVQVDSEVVPLPAPDLTPPLIEGGAAPPPVPKELANAPQWMPADSFSLLPGVSERPSVAAATTPPTPVAKKAPAESTMIQVKAEQRTLFGELQSFRGSWRLRYAAVEAEDALGGCVLLEGVGRGLNDGQRVRVQGQLFEPSDRFDTARFRVEKLEVLD